MQPHERIIVAYDRSTASETDIALLQKLAGEVGMVKLGLETISAITYGNSIPVYYRLLPILHHAKIGIMADWKLKDIPNTVAKTVANIAAEHGAWGITMHADADTNVIEAAVKNRGSANIIGVTVLTSMSSERCETVHGCEASRQVGFLAELLAEANAQAIVCSPLEVADIAAAYKDRLVRITPGIRAKDAPPDDQKRTMTARDAINAGADYLVIGRPIMEAPDPVAAARRFAEEIASAHANLSMV
ncbi:MAG: orotidine-5'-phosphate decarboxylase [Minisyncoccia bacterium]